jgi:tRNA pseudouridine synthase 10
MEQRNWHQDNTVLKAAEAILRAGPICDECIGRAFAKLGHGLSNRRRGELLREALTAQAFPAKSGSCWVCEDLFEKIPEWADRAVELASGIEHESYLFGVRLTPRLTEMETFFQEQFPTGHEEPLKHAFNRGMGKAFEARIGSGTLALTRPHLSFIVNLVDDRLELRILPIYIYGRYQKFLRGLPQTHWPCRQCRGKGCKNCNFTGKQYPESVEELVAAPFLEAACAEGAHLHGAGREDVDARMLGTGRPFVLELIAPTYRGLDLETLGDAVNTYAGGKVQISNLRFVPQETVALIKETSAEKTYRVGVAFDTDISAIVLEEALSALVGSIEQRTPQRVAHRRADRVRKRRVLEARGTLLSPREATVEFRTQGGLYVKELVSGDGGRTRPNLSESLSVAARVIILDVMSVSSGVFPDECST